MFTIHHKSEIFFLLLVKLHNVLSESWTHNLTLYRKSDYLIQCTMKDGKQTFTYVSLSTHCPTREPKSTVAEDSTTPYIAAKSKEFGQMLIMYKPTENSHILQTRKEFNKNSIEVCLVLDWQATHPICHYCTKGKQNFKWVCLKRLLGSLFMHQGWLLGEKY